jgi:hypothetical protein
MKRRDGQSLFTSAETAHCFFPNTANLFLQFQPGLRFRVKGQVTSKFIFEIKGYFLMEFLKGLPCVCEALSLG